MSRDLRRDLLMIGGTLVVLFFLVLGAVGANALNRTGTGLEGIATALAEGTGAIKDVIAGAGKEGFDGLTSATLAQSQPQDCKVLYKGWPQDGNPPTPVPAPFDGKLDGSNVCQPLAGSETPDCYQTPNPMPTPLPTPTPGPVHGWRCDLLTDDLHEHGINSDATLTGDGTQTAPLGVANPFTAAEETKLAGIEDGAQENPPHSLRFSAQDNDTLPASALDAGEIGFYSGCANLNDTTGCSQVQGPNLNLAKTIFIPKKAAAFGLDPTQPGTDLEAQETTPFMSDILSGNVLLSIEKRQGLTNYTYFISSTITEYGSNGYRVNVAATSGGQAFSGSGYAWDVEATPVHPQSVHNIVDIPDWVLVDGSNVSPALKAAIQGANESVTLTNTFRVDVSNVDYYVSLTQGTPNIARIRLPSSAAGTDDDTDLKRLLQPAAWVRVGDYEIDVTTNASRAVIGTSLTFTFNYVAVTGTKPTGSTPVDVTVVGEDVHRGQLARQSFKDETPSIAGKGGTAAQVWTRAASDTDAGWADSAHIPKEQTVPFAAAFRDLVGVTWAVSNNGTGDTASVSSGNSKPSGAPDGTTDFIVIAEGAGESTLQKVKVGDWFRAARVNNYIIAKVQFTQTNTVGQYTNYLFWFNPSTDIAETLAYDQIGTGAGEVRFYIIPDIPAPTGESADGGKCLKLNSGGTAYELKTC